MDIPNRPHNCRARESEVRSRQTTGPIYDNAPAPDKHPEFRYSLNGKNKKNRLFRLCYGSIILVNAFLASNSVANASIWDALNRTTPLVCVETASVGRRGIREVNDGW